MLVVFPVSDFGLSLWLKLEHLLAFRLGLDLIKAASRLVLFTFKLRSSHPCYITEVNDVTRDLLIIEQVATLFYLVGFFSQRYCSRYLTNLKGFKRQYVTTFCQVQSR